MRRLAPVVLLLAASSSTACGDEAMTNPCEDNGVTFTSDVLPRVVGPYCLSCHSDQVSGPDRAGAPIGVDFDTWTHAESRASALANAVTSGTMPPAGRPRPTREERDLVETWRLCGFSGGAP